MTPLLEWMGIYHPEPIKVWWVALTLLSVALRWWLVVRLIRSPGYQWPGLCAYLFASSWAVLAPNHRTWGMPVEIPLALATALLVVEAVSATSFLVRAPERRYARMFAAAVGLLVLSATVAAVPPPYAGYPTSWYFTRLYSMIAALAVLVASAVYCWLERSRVDRTFLLHNLILLPWFAVQVYAGLWRSTSTEPLRPDQWPVRLTVVAVQIACLSAWHLRVVEPTKSDEGYCKTHE